MTPEKCAETWKEICFILYKSVRQDMLEKDFEGQVVRAVETLGWKEYKKEIKRQPAIKIGRGKKLIPDLVVYGEKDRPLIAIEVKKPTEDLTKDDVSSQLQSYMRILKTEYGLVIGKTIRFFYDGELYPQNEPVLLGEIKFDDEDSTEGQEFVSNINKNNMAKQNHTQYLKNLISKVKEIRSIKKLKQVLETKETKDKILAYLRNEFIEYGSEIVEGTLKSMDIQIKLKGTVIPPVPEPNPQGSDNDKKVYTENNLLNSIPENIKESYFKIKDIIYELDSGIDTKITKTMICYYSDGKGLIWINPKKNNIQILLRKGKYRDKYMKIKHEGTFGGYPLLVLKENVIDYDYLKDIFQQAYDIR